jgi:hypothetical protein
MFVAFHAAVLLFWCCMVFFFLPHLSVFKILLKLWKNLVLRNNHGKNESASFYNRNSFGLLALLQRRAAWPSAQPPSAEPQSQEPNSASLLSRPAAQCAAQSNHTRCISFSSLVQLTHRTPSTYSSWTQPSVETVALTSDSSVI